MGKAMGYGLVAVMFAALLMGCGGGGGGNNAELDRLLDAETAREAAEAERSAAEEAKAEAEAEAKAAAEAKAKAEAEAKAIEDAKAEAEAKAAEEAKALAAEEARKKAEAAQQAQLDALTKAIEALAAAQTAAETAEDDEEEEEEVAAATTAATTTTTTTTTPTTTPTTPAARSGSQSVEANERAKLLETAFDDLTTTYPAPVVPNSKGNAFTLANHSHSALTAPGLRGSRLKYAAFGETIVAYTDRELTRKLLDHYYTHREGTTADARKTATRFQIDSAGAGFTLTNVSGPASSTQVRVPGHSYSASYTGDTAPTAKPPRKTWSGTVHGVGGTFECVPTGTSCTIALTPTYDTSTKTLTSVAMASADGTLYFRSSGTLTLDGTPAKGGFTDDEYMAFGWWRSKPSSLPGSYDFETFVLPVDAAETLIAGRYLGTAVGMYVERDAATVARQGEFTANVRLTATASSVTGEINTFRTTPTDGSAASTTSGNWRVALGTTDDATAARILGVSGAPSSTGSWTRGFVAARTESGASDSPSVVGEFITEIPMTLHIVGAFGAKGQGQ